MNIKLNNENNPSIVLLDGVENVITFDEANTGQTTIIEIYLQDGLGNVTSADSQWYIMLFDETITSVNDYSNATNRRFWATNDGNSLGASIANALRNCSSIAAEWEIYQDNNLIKLTSRTIGNKTASYAYWQRTNIPSQYCTITLERTGSASSLMQDGKCTLAVFDEETGSQIAVLTKQKYGRYTDFNISKLLESYTEYGKVKEFSVNASTTTKQGDWAEQTSFNFFMTKGYECNGSSPYLARTGTKILWNKYHNGSENIQYVYAPMLTFSVLSTAPSAFSVRYSLLNSAMSQIYTTTQSYTPTSSNPQINDISFSFPQTAWTGAYYARIEIGSESLTFGVIKPLYAAEYWQRVLWRNEYGGIEFFDFTGKKEEAFNIDQDQDTYNVNTFQRYRTGGHLPKEKIYASEVTKTYTLTTHLLERDAKYNFDSLALSKEVWTVIGSETYHIIPTGMAVSENETYNNIFTATLTYRLV